MDEAKPEKVKLVKQQEWRFEVDFDATLSVQLLDGHAEIFGTEMTKSQPYLFKHGTKAAIFSFHGCTLLVKGNKKVAYLADETPMPFYLNMHGVLEDRRKEAEGGPSLVGPRAMLVGPVDVGKSTLSKLLINYAVRAGRQPLYVDLDVGQGQVTIPGMLAAAQMERVIDPVLGMHTSTPLAYFFGHASPGENLELFVRMMERLRTSLEERQADNRDAREGGMIINTCGWVDGVGFKLLCDTIKVFEPDVVFVIGHERLYFDLVKECGEMRMEQPTLSVECVKVPKSGGVVARDTGYRRKSRMDRIRQYFYGPEGDLLPQSTAVSFRDITIYRVGSDFLQLPAAAMASALPAGTESLVNPVHILEVIPDPSLVFTILTVMHADTSDDLLDANVAGFLYVTEVNLDQEHMRVLAPCPGPLPGKFALLGSLKWSDER